METRMLTLFVYAILGLLAITSCGRPHDGAPGGSGPAGHDGAPGLQGPTGPDGAPAPAVTAVQFCPSQGNTTYPNNFPETGLCVSDKLYGVYWDGHGAWLAELPPGRYQSTATGLACSFTILAHCGVQE